VELVLATPIGLSTTRGSAHLELPKLPYPVTHLEWELFLPEDLRYRFAGGNVEPATAEVAAATSAVEGGVPGGVVGYAFGFRDAPRRGDLERGNGGLIGQVFDDNKAALPGANVTLRDERSGRSLTAVTDANGFYRFAEVPGGNFRLRAELPGFKAADRPITLAAGGNVGADLTLGLSSVNAQVTVSGEVSLDASKNESGAVLHDVMRKSGTPPAAAPPQPPRDVLTASEKAALQRTIEAGVNAIPIELPETGKRLRFEGRLFVTEAPALDLQVRAARKGWLW